MNKKYLPAMLVMAALTLGSTTNIHAKVYDFGGEQSFKTVTIAELKQKIVQGDAIANNELGCRLLEGRGISQEHEKGIVYLQAAAKQNLKTAQYNLGVVYQNGLGVPQNHTEAAKWFKKSADQGYSAAQISLGRLYRDGLGVAKDAAGAVSWYQKAAVQEHQVAQCELGYMYYWGME